MASVSAAALMPSAGFAENDPSFEDFAAEARASSGFDAIPRDMLGQLYRLLGAQQRRNFVQNRTASDEERKMVLKALFTGQYQAGEDAPERIAYAQALMFAAIEDNVNVPSYCGGMPGFWAEKPAGL